jgi:chemotaxis protein methyltransferase CheR
MTTAEAAQVEDVEIRLLLEGVQQVYGYDFRDYADASIKRRLTQWLAESPFDTFSGPERV